jgi:hypothetical protein
MFARLAWIVLLLLAIVAGVQRGEPELSTPPTTPPVTINLEPTP